MIKNSLSRTTHLQYFASENTSDDTVMLPPLCVFCLKRSAHRQILCRCSPPEHLCTSGQRHYTFGSETCISRVAATETTTVLYSVPLTIF